MEFNEKLQELRKSKGLTQEELSEILYVSRTAISKWESGRGYPNIDSLKDISEFFSVTIDDLLSSEKIMSIAENENKSNIQNIYDLLFGIVDLMNITLILLPLYPKPIAEHIYFVNLLGYTELSSVIRIIYWIMFVTLIILGIIKIIINQIKSEKRRNIITNISLSVNIVSVLLLAMTCEPYALSVIFSLLIIKTILIFKKSQYK